MTELWSEMAGDPAYRHVLLNHFPITGLAIAACVLAWGVLENRWSSIALGLGLCLLMSASAIAVLQTGEAAYPFLFDRLDGHGQGFLDAHADLAATWGRLLPANALLAAAAIALGLRRIDWRRRVGLGVLLSSGIALAGAVVVAESGGRIRHAEFRTSPSAGEGGSIAGGPLAMRRLTEAQYRGAIADVFGAELEIAGRFEPEGRRDGLIAVSSAFATITPSGFEQYEGMAREIARQVVSPPLRDRAIPCQPSDPAAPDDACSEATLRRMGPRLLRRPLDDAEIAKRVAAARAAAVQLGDFDAGIELLVASLLVAPDFLFRIEAVKDGASADGGLSLTDATLASRLSYLLWNAGPDEALLARVSTKELSDPDVYSEEVDRLLASPRFEAGLRAFFDDFFRFDAFDELSKDPIRYPMFSARVAADAREQTLRTVVDHLLARDGDYRALFTTRRTFMTRVLGPVYALPVRTESGWEAFELPATGPRAGLLAHASFNMLNAHPGRSSPTLRGLHLREALLCQDLPPAPANVDFGLFNADDDPKYRTARERLEVHSSNTSCRSCHARTDPIGLGLEQFDGLGRFRSAENGAPIDPRGELDGRAFADAVSLGAAVAESPLLSKCLVESVYRYAVGRRATSGERSMLRGLERAFEDEGHRIAPLMRAIALSPGFRTATTANGEGERES